MLPMHVQASLRQGNGSGSGQVHSRQKENVMTNAKYVIVRTYSAGVFAGELTHRDGKEVELRNARRLWFWAGAASLSQLAVDGTSKPGECKFPVAITVTLTEAIEVIEVTDTGRASIEAVPAWSA